MSPKINLKLLLFINLIIQAILFEGKVDYKINSIKDMRTTFLSTKEEKMFYYLGSLLEDNAKIIAFADLNGDKLTDIIAYKIGSKSLDFYAYYYTKKSDDNEEVPKFKAPQKLFSLNNTNNYTVRNMYVGSFFGVESDICYLISLNDENETTTLHHFIKCGEKETEPKELKDVNSNILILNKDKENKMRLLYFKETRKICTLKKGNDYYYCDSDKNFGDWLNTDKNCKSEGKEYLDKPISTKGGIAFVDLDGDCLPDIVLTHDENDKRLIEIYTSKRQYDDNKKYCLKQIIELEDKDKYGAFAITRVNDDKDENSAPMLDIIIPLIKENKINIYKNQRKIGYKWSNNYCNQDFANINNDTLFYNYSIDTLSVEGYSDLEIEQNYPTVIRVGDFLGSSNPGILLRQKKKGSNISIISLFKREEKQFKHYTSIEMDKIIDEKKPEGDEFLMGLFFDIDETGTLSLILPSSKGKNYFFFNYQRTVYFLKAKLMNHQKNLFDTNLGATYRYIVTDKNGDRHMDVAHQLSQTSDMNIPVPYSIMGLDDTNNYVEYFQTISGNYLNETSDEFENKEETDWKTNSPIIPNTQMMIFKFNNTDKKCEWNVDLIVQPMEQIWLFLIIVVFVLLIVLGVIIYLHVKELKEEEKETNKFKSWFA